MSDTQQEQQAPKQQASAEVLYSENQPVVETPAVETPNAEVNQPAEIATPNSETPPAETPAEPQKADEQKTDDKNKTKVDEPKPETPPEKYELKLPDQSPVDPSRLEKIAAEAKAKGLTQEQAQGLVDREHTVVTELVESHRSRVQQWAQEAIADKEIGGPDINRNIELAKRVVDTYGSPLLKEQLEASGYGQHPEMLRLFVRIGKASGEDRLVRGGGTPPPAKKSAADLLFGEDPQT